MYLYITVVIFHLFTMNLELTATFDTKTTRAVDDHSCQIGLPYKMLSPFDLSNKDPTNIAFNNASLLKEVSVLVMKMNSSSCCAQVGLHDCISGHNYNLSTCDRRIFILKITARAAVIPGDTYILSFKRNDTCTDRVSFLLKRTDQLVFSTTTTKVNAETTKSQDINLTITVKSELVGLTEPSTTFSSEIVHNRGTIYNKIDPYSTGNLNFYSIETSKTVVTLPEYQQLYSSTEATIVTTRTDIAWATNALQNISPLLSSIDTHSMIPSLVPTNVNRTVVNGLTTFELEVSKSSDQLVFSTATTTVYVETANKRDDPDSTIPLGITIGLFAVAVVVISFFILRILYKSRKDVHVKSDETSVVFCTNDFIPNPGFINEVPMAVATHDYINIRKVSDSNTDEMTEIEDKRYSNKTYGDSSYLGGSASGNSPCSKYAGLSGYKKYPAPQPNKSSNYVANKSSRCSTFQSDAEYFQHKRH